MKIFLTTPARRLLTGAPAAALQLLLAGMVASGTGCMTAGVHAAPVQGAASMSATTPALSSPPTPAAISAQTPNVKPSPVIANGLAIVMQDQLALRAAARDSSQQHALLSAGEVLEVRGERLDFLQVYEHRRERAGFVRASRVKRLKLSADEAPELLAVLRFVRETPGSETLGIGLAAAWLKAAPAAAVNGASGIEVLDALAGMADRLAARASGSTGQNKGLEGTLAAHLEVARSYGLAFPGFERDGRMQVCYDGDAFRRVLAMPASEEQKARAALALTRPECIDPTMRPLELHRLDQWRSQVLEQVQAEALPGYLKNRIHMRRASVWAALAYQQARINSDAKAPDEKAMARAGQQALNELALVRRAELTEDDQSLYNDSAMRVSASRWSAATAPLTPNAFSKAGIAVRTEAGEAGQTCLVIQEEGKTEAKSGKGREAFRKCSYSLLWAASLSIHTQGRLISIAAQPTETWREMWLLRKSTDGWALDVLPPASNGPELGYAEFAGFTPDAQQVLVARESRIQSRYKRSFELLRIEGLVSEKSASEPALLASFQRWQDAAWKQGSLSLR